MMEKQQWEMLHMFLTEFKEITCSNTAAICRAIEANTKAIEDQTKKLNETLDLMNSVLGGI